MTGPVGYIHEGAVALIRIDNPRVNATSVAVRARLVAAFAQFAEGEDARIAVLYDAGHGFVAGADPRAAGLARATALLNAGAPPRRLREATAPSIDTQGVAALPAQCAKRHRGEIAHAVAIDAVGGGARGLGTILRRIEDYAHDDDHFWTPAPLLRDLVGAGATFDSLRTD